MHPEAAAVVPAVADCIAAASGDELVGLVLHGSAVAGDFAPGRSDLDLLAVLRQDPDDSVLVRLAALHARLEERHPAWAGRVEVEYVAQDLVASVDPARRFARISPGEPLHLVPAIDHYLLNRAAARDGVALRGPAPAALVPAVPAATVRAVVLRHVTQWPAWVREGDGAGFLAYAVLTLCRAGVLLEHGRRVSKHAAARESAAALPEYAALIDWADRWWYGGGSEADRAPLTEVRAFVDERARRLLARSPAPSADPEERRDTPG